MEWLKDTRASARAAHAEFISTTGGNPPPAEIRHRRKSVATTGGNPPPNLKKNLQIDSIAHPADGATYSALKIGGGEKAKTAYPDGFEAFWAAYPKKRGKAKAAERWGRMSVTERDEAMAAIGVYMRDKKARDGFVQQADTYLNKRTWEDYPPAELAGDPDAQLWTGRLKRYAENRAWPIRGQWGPPPGAPGCTVPQPIIDRYFDKDAEGRLIWKAR